MTSSPVRPENWGGNAEQPAGLHAPEGIGSAWGCQVAPPSWLTSSASARSLQSVVSQPSRRGGDAGAGLVAAVGGPPGAGGGGRGGRRCARGGAVAGANVQRAPPSVVR